MKGHQYVSLICLVFVVYLSVACGFFEPMKNSARSLSIRKMRDDEDDIDSAVSIETYRFKLENVFNRKYHDNLDLFRERADKLATETFEMDSSLEACGKDCEECQIPEEWKSPFGPADGIDVMEFLGIKRAKPLRAKRDKQ